jgi:ferric-dicitrate binding protein FerR (iron transport regulator)
VNRERLSLLIEAWRDGDVAPDDAAALAAVIGDQGAGGAWVREQLAAIGLIAQALDDADGAAMVASLRERMRAEANASRFVRSVGARQARTARPSRRSAAYVPRRRGLWPVACAAALVAAVALGAFALLQSRGAEGPRGVDLATLQDLDGTVTCQRAGHNLAGAVGMRLGQGDRLVLGQDAHARWTYADGSDLRGDDRAAIVFLDDGSAGKRLRLEAGTLRAEVAHQPEGRPCTIATALAECTVLGTRLTLTAAADRAVLSVAQGRVRLQSGLTTESIEVPAGFSATVAAGVPLVASATAPATVAPPPAAPAAPAVIARVIDDHEGVLRWFHEPYSAPLDFALSRTQAHGGGQALRVAYRMVAGDAKPYAQIFHPVHLAAGDRRIRFWVRVENAQPESTWQVQVCDAANCYWKQGLGRCADFKPGWNEVTVPLIDQPENAFTPDGVTAPVYQRERVNAIALNLYGGDVVLYVDDLELLPAQ